MTARKHLPRLIFPILFASFGLSACAQMPSQKAATLASEPTTASPSPAPGATNSPAIASAYVARAQAPIHENPGDGGAVIAMLRKGQRVLSSRGNASGWAAIDLDDGSVGYVPLDALREVQPNASEKMAATFMEASAPQASAAAN